MIQEFIKKVGEFHDAFGVKRGNVDIELRYKLFKEEFDEYKDAKTLVDKADAIVDMLYIACGTLDLYKKNEVTLEYLYDFQDEDFTLKGLIYFLNNYRNEIKTILSIECLIDEILTLAYINNIYDKLPQLFGEVHRSNMSKLDDNGKPIINDGILDTRKPVGKILKSNNYFEPNLKDILYAN